MKDIFYKKLLFSLLPLLPLLVMNSLQAQQDVSRTIHKLYDFTNSGELQVENKYGNIVVNGWNQNKIQITVDIMATKKNEEDAKELLARIKPSITSSPDFINIFSNIEEKNNGFFSRMINKANPFDVDRGSVQIDYTIHLPTNADVQVINKFGDIIINDWNGKLKVNLQHGDMWINNNLNKATIEIKFGKLQSKEISYANIKLKNSELEIEESKDLSIMSNGSTININEAINLEIYSSKDKVTIGNLERIQGELSFSNMRLKQVKEDINLRMDVADLVINKIIKPDANITIKQKSSELNINISNLSFDFNAYLQEGLLRIPKSFTNIKTTIIDNRSKLRDVTASYGSGKKGKIQITGKKGVILIKEL
ncbi:hypothetical protein [Aquimarina sp. RZ0]|uniref:hypothetical protein n=1 Tax=Aquimarina sp. RZ0 TaxID=2607730 RepID=UPI0011F0C96C|nr:hypothetical protein [Aquimarina sp. RZ0]KAA1247096.1 hypothetical protein F0000_05270 [Aquimarina sp. RZ0]